MTTLRYSIAVAAGIAAWAGSSVIDGIMSGDVGMALRREAWDGDLYWIVGLPLSYLAAGVLGYFGPGIARWPVIIMASQLVCMLLLSGVGPLLPLGIAFMVALAVPGIASAAVGRFVGRVRDTADKVDRGPIT